MENDFYAYLYRLKYIERWSLMRNMERENVSEHTYQVAIITHALCEIGNQLYGKNINAEKAALTALFHDATEMFTGDIPTPVKHHNPDILNSFRTIEQKAAERLIQMTPEPLREVYRPLLISDPQDPIQSFIKAADLLDAYIKCTIELTSGNREFAEAQKKIRHSIEQLDMPEVDYFLKHLAPGFEKTLDEMTRGLP